MRWRHSRRWRCILLEFRRSAADVWAVPAQILVLDAAPCGDPVKGAHAGG
jgi:hypothetical protein